MSQAAHVMLGILDRIGELFKIQRQQLHGANPLTFFPTIPFHVEGMSGTIADGQPVLSLRLTTGVRLDFQIPENAFDETADFLDGLRNLVRKAPPRPH
jgi:hypothetical protein